MQPNFNSKDIKMIIGLGNPGQQYAKTYHNAGFLFIDYLKKNNLQPATSNLKTNCYINESGGFVKKEIRKKRIRPAETLVVHDDSDLELGNYKFSFGRGSAGHKGVESIIKSLGTENFWRLRIGIRKDNSKFKIPAKGEARQRRQNSKSRQKAGDFVLKKISPNDKTTLEKILAEAARKLLSWRVAESDFKTD